MSFLLDTNICSAHLKRSAGLMHRFIQHSGRLYIPTIVLGELYTWAFRRNDPSQVIPRIENDLLTDVVVLDFDSQCAKKFGEIRGPLLQPAITRKPAATMARSRRRLRPPTAFQKIAGRSRLSPENSPAAMARCRRWLRPPTAFQKIAGRSRLLQRITRPFRRAARKQRGRLLAQPLHRLLNACRVGWSA